MNVEPALTLRDVDKTFGKTLASTALNLMPKNNWERVTRQMSGIGS